MVIRRRGQGYDVAVIGGGTAGLTAAWHAAQHGLSVALFEGGMLFGGQVANLDRLDGFPAAAELSGVALASALVDRIREQGGEILQGEVTSLGLGGPAKQVTTGAGVHRAKHVVVASGARLRTLGVQGEQELLGRGISQCTTCDGPLFRGQDVVVVGGGDAALQGAIALSAFCRSVSVVVRGDLRARRAYVDRTTASGNLRFVWDSAVVAVRGE